MCSAMAKSFSSRYVAYLLEKVGACKPAAVDYIANIEELWQSTDWNSCERQLPSRYGIVTSNTSECVNNVFGEARDLGWLEAVDKLVDVMSTIIFQCRMKHATKEATSESGILRGNNYMLSCHTMSFTNFCNSHVHCDCHHILSNNTIKRT